MSPSGADPKATAPCSAHVVAPIAQPPAFDWAGKSLQFVQSFVLVLTFVIAFAERKRNRVADRFGDTVVKFAAELGDKFYADTERLLAELRGAHGRFFSAQEFEDKRKRLLSDFARELFHTRTLLLLRARLFPHCDLGRLNAVFEDLEDTFTFGVANLKIDDEHPETLTTNVAEASSKLLEYLMEREVVLERSSFKKRLVALYRKVDAELEKSA